MSSSSQRTVRPAALGNESTTSAESTGSTVSISKRPSHRKDDMNMHEPGSVSDLTVICSRIEVHVAALKTNAADRKIYYNGERFQAYPDQWAILVDKSYIGLSSPLRAIHPQKKPINGTLDCHDLDRNAAVSSDRVIVENFFFRVCLLWKISYGTFVWGTKIYDAILQLTFALKNFHVSSCRFVKMTTASTVLYLLGTRAWLKSRSPSVQPSSAYIEHRPNAWRLHQYIPQFT
ncbi:hypothetical protein H257_18463 [Aphanomyces astaci]|uniref:DDE Tnp4 domain-containing protein n=1 Tax=Aphanomyces astaci TaxID=112090 RepID=W4FB10_APHAT|nr:hypothetical protein H257_18463 [Aphanomyces astaci]ETV64685.1 hypothetical protein H257_18463 [Aphanomyces astaci]|eukprot:XP_009845820.1 hypothetical protein H257_18463 [Aphanomyces astaci]